MAKAHLNDEEALRIIQLGLEGNLDTRLEADYFGVSPETIRRIVRRDTYRHLRTQSSLWNRFFMWKGLSDGAGKIE